MKSKKDELLEDIVEWDIANWGRAIAFWENYYDDADIKGKKVLDIGGRNGGLSLYWALKGANVICSDVDNKQFERARALHSKYGVEERIKYEVVDALNIPYAEELDIICFKSVLGGVGGNDNFINQQNMMENIAKALKKGGLCFFVENTKATKLHHFLRTRFRKWGGDGGVTLL